MAFEIESNWSQFVPFRELLNWLPDDGAGRAAHDYLRGINAFVEQRFDEATSAFEAVLQSDRRYLNADIYLLRMIAPDKAVTQLRGHGRSDSEIALAVQIGFENQVFAGPDAQTLLARAIALSAPDHDDLCILLKETCKTIESLRNACKIWEESTNKNASVVPLLLLGDAHQHLGELETATSFYERARSQFPDDWRPPRELALLARDLDANAAGELFREALGLSSLNAEERPAVLRSALELAMGCEAWADAVEFCTELRELCPDDQDLQDTLGVCQQKGEATTG